MLKGNYSARITRKSPSAFVFMVDISGSMGDKIVFNGETMTKAGAVALNINNIISELVLRCKRDDGYRDYFDIAVIGYGGEEARSLLPEGVSHNLFRKPSELAHMKTGVTKIFRERKLPNGRTTVTTVETKSWMEASAQGKTPMLDAFNKTYGLLGEWLVGHGNADCFPPIVINITDGESTDCDDRDLLNIAEKIKNLSTRDGNILLMNIFITPDSEGKSVTLPSSLSELPDKPYAKLLFEMSSELPGIYYDNIEGKNRPCKGMCYNASMSDIVNMLNIGSVSVNLMQ